MPIMTGLSGNEIYCLGLKGLTPGEIVIGNSVQSIGFIGGIGAGLQSLFGGEVTEVTEAISQGRVECYRRMEHEAQQHDALAITGVTSELRSMQGNIEFLSVGSCIKRGADGRAGEPPMTTMERERRAPVRAASVRQRFVEAFRAEFGFDRLSLFHALPELTAHGSFDVG